RGGARADTPFPGLVRSSSPRGRQRRKVTSANCASRKRGGLDATSSAGAAGPQLALFEAGLPPVRAGGGNRWRLGWLRNEEVAGGTGNAAQRGAGEVGGGRSGHGSPLGPPRKARCGHHGRPRHRRGPWAITRFCPVLAGNPCMSWLSRQFFSKTPPRAPPPPQ